MEFGMGLTFERFNKLRISAEYTVGKWSNYELTAKSDKLFDIENLNSRFGQNKLQKNQKTEILIFLKIRIFCFNLIVLWNRTTF
jgi:hypothetical protein